VIREGELLVLDLRNAALPDVGDTVVAVDDTEDAGRARRVTVGILAGAGGDAQRFGEIASSVKETASFVRFVFTSLTPQL